MKLDKSLKYLIATSKDVNEANKLIEGDFKDYADWSWSSKFKLLEDNFVFSMAGGYTQETEPEKIMRENYYATLQYIIHEARDFGLKSVCKE